jgi:2-oxo-4-hydroxy-4-carboxy-5-ureidoimidazoline decarboxylase
MTLNDLNRLTQDAAIKWFEQCCASEKWCLAMVESRPYEDCDHMLKEAQNIWQNLQEGDFLQAFLAHPMIGNVDSLRKKYANTLTIASNEQSGTSQASEATLSELSTLNQQYLTRNGFIFIICASGLSAEAMLNKLKQRINNDRYTELTIAASEQIKITLLRLEKSLATTDRTTM